MSPRFARRGQNNQEDTTGQAAEALLSPLFDVAERDERRIHSWSPDPFAEQEEPPAEPKAEAAPLHEPRARPRPVATPAPAPAVVEPPPAAVRAAAPATEAPAPQPEPQSGSAAPAPRRRGRPRSKVPRRQVHFHVDPDEERLLLAAARTYGSQQKGIIAALESLQENEVLRDEIDRLRAECDHQRRLLAQAESLFKR